jgi:D-beta-D-heptose 7-phosphate kinase/D-beta-D-heptose 1-phosphate adenosyltransferase
MEKKFLIPYTAHSFRLSKKVLEMRKSHLLAIIKKFPHQKVAVFGDIMLDEYLYGTVSRISPEAPVPILRVEKKEYFLGGAANVAHNISSLGGKAHLFGLLGDDHKSKTIIRMLDEKGISHTLYDRLKETIQKTRIIASNQQIVRVDSEEAVALSMDIEKNIRSEIAHISPSIIVVSDYAKGFITVGLLSLLKDYTAQNGIKLIIDPKPGHKHFYPGAFLITPNTSEAFEMSGVYSIEEAGKKLKDELSSHILITKGKDGMSLFEKGNDKVLHFPTRAREVYDITGAGDTVAAALSLALSTGATLKDATILANHVAGLVVEKIGTACVSKSELEDILESENKKIRNLAQIKEIVQDYKQKGKKIVWTNGCFDLLHGGHVKYLEKARQFGDVLIVGLNSDESVRRLKGSERPILKQEERAEILSALEFVDYILIFSEENVSRHLKQIKPEVYVKGGDYDIERIDQEEKKVLLEYRATIQFIPFIKGYASSDIVKKIKRETKKKHIQP